MAVAVTNPYVKPAQAAFRSNAPQPSPSSAWDTAAVPGTR